VGVKETQKYVGELLGLDWKGFNTSFLARQQELNALSDLQPKKRQDHLAGMLGIEKVDKAITRVKEDIKVNKAQIQLLETQIGESGQLEKRIADLSLKLTELQENKGKLQADLTSVEKILREKADAFQKFQEAKSEWVKFSAQIKAVNDTIVNLNNIIENLKTEKEDLSKIKDTVGKIEKETACLQNLKEEQDRLKTAKSQFEVAKQLKERIKEQDDRKKNISTDLKRLTEAIDKYNSQLKEIPGNIESLVEKSRIDLEEMREKFSDEKAKVEAVKSQIEILKQQMKDINQFGPESVCDRCQRPLGDDLPDIKKHLKEELNSLISKMESESIKLSELKDIGVELKSKSDNLKQSLDLFKEINIKLTSSIREQTNYQQQIQDLGISINKDKSQFEKIDRVKFDEMQFNSLTTQINGLEKMQVQLNRYQGKLTRQPIVDDEIIKTESSIKKAKQDLEDLQKELEMTAFSESSFQTAKEQFETAQNEMDTAKGHVVAVINEIELTNKSLEYETERLAQIQKIGQQLDEYRDSHFYGQKLSQLMSQFREHLISRIRPTLADISSKLMEEMSDGRYSMVELDEDYNLRLMDSGSFFGIDRFSGGEKDLANLCLRLSISLSLTESDRSFIILDEVFGSQDENRKELILKAMVNLKQRFPQILLITHIEDIRDRVDALIELERQPSGWSEVKIIGQGLN